MPKTGTLKVVAGVAASFISLVGVIIFLSEAKIIGFELAMLMFVALLGLYLGFGVLVIVYRLVGKLD